MARHRATDRDETRSYTEATCVGLDHHQHLFCPRHEPASYAEVMARHATDSITPAQRYHSSNAWGR